MRRALTLLTALVLAAGCGGEEEKDVKNAFGAWASATETGNGASYCDALTRESVELIERIANPVGEVTADCEDTMDQRLRADDERGGALDQNDLAALEEAEVEIEDDSAKLKDEKDALAMRRVEGEWLVDLAGTPELGFELRVEAACGENLGARLERRIPAATRKGVAAEAEAEAKSLAGLRRTLAEADPPADLRAAATRFERAIARAEQRWRSAAKALRGLGAPLESYNKAAKAVAELGRKADADARKLGLECITRGTVLPDSEDYARAAERACKRTVEQVAEIRSPAAFRRAIEGAARRLAAIDPPGYLDDKHEGAVKALRGVAPALPRSQTEAAIERFELRVLRSAVGFVHLGLPTCAQL